ncbi:MAG: MGMT family protein [Balneolales bacterium]
MIPKHNNSADFFKRVYEVVAAIPYSKVTTYGAIAEHLGVRSGARAVGWALNKTLTHYLGEEIPCHRVVNRLGQLSGKVHFGGNVMEERLRQEGVVFLSPDTIDLKQHFWHPDEGP